MTEEHYNILKGYEFYLDNALNKDYLIGMSGTIINDISNIWNEISGNKQPLNSGCSYCVLKLFKDVAKIYYQK